MTFNSRRRCWRWGQDGECGGTGLEKMARTDEGAGQVGMGVLGQEWARGK